MQNRRNLIAVAILVAVLAGVAVTSPAWLGENTRQPNLALAQESSTGTPQAEATGEETEAATPATTQEEATGEADGETPAPEATTEAAPDATAEGEAAEEATTEEPTAEEGSEQATEEATAEATPVPAGIPTTREDVVIPGDALPVDASIQLVKVADGLVDPVNVVSARDGSGRLFVVERHGVVRIVTGEGDVLNEPFLDIQDQVLSAFLEQGLYDLEFHPDYAENGRFFVHFSELMRNGDGMIFEYAVSPENPDQADPESAKPILQIEQPWANHNGGELAFGPDGYLYIGSGDGGWEGDPLEAGQDLKSLLGKLLRIDVNVQDGRPYTIPQDNPFASAQSPQLIQLFGVSEAEFAQIHTEARPEIWAYGLRNPWKFSFDPETGDLYLPDVGQNYWEEINFQPANSEGGENYGWDILMGSHCFPIEQGTCATLGVLPVAEYSHPEHSGCAVIGIGTYRGDEFANLDGVYFSGDYCSGIIWGLMRDESDTWHYAPVVDTNLQLTGSGQDEDGTLYVTTCHCNYGGPNPTENAPGTLWRIVAADAVPEGAETAPTQ